MHEEFKGSIADNDTTEVDNMSMRTESLAPSDIEDYNREKAAMHDQLQALKAAADNGDPSFNAKLEELIAKTGAVQNIEKTNQVQSFIEEGDDVVLARADY